MHLRVSAKVLIAILPALALAQSQAPKEPLSKAALDGDLGKVRALLKAGANPNLRDEQNWTPLLRVASAHNRSTLDIDKTIEHNYEGVANLLLDQGADVNARDDKGRTALLIAMDGSASEYRVIGAADRLARLLVLRGADVNAHDENGWTPLLKVLDLWAEQASLLDFLIAHGANVNARLNDGRTGLMLAARLGKDMRFAPLIANGADVNAHDQTGATALMVASTIQWNDSAVAILKLLIAKHANLNLKDNQGNTAADRAAAAGYLARARLLIDSGTKIADLAAFQKNARNQALLRAIDERDVPAAKTLLDQGADPNFQDPTGWTLLMISSNDEYSAERVSLLLSKGASVNLAAKDGDTALMIAADRYQPQIVKALLDHGANPNAVDRNGRTVLMRASASKYSWQEEKTPLIPLLLQKGTDATRKDAHGTTALMLMAREGNPAVETLLKTAVDIDARDEEGNTALLYAARFFARGWPRRNGWALLNKGAVVNAANLKGETPLILAATQFESDAAQLLVEKGANVNARTKAGRTALMQAIDQPKEFDNDNHVVYSPQIARLLIASGADTNAQDDQGNSALSIARKRGYEDMVTALLDAGAKQ